MELRLSEDMLSLTKVKDNPALLASHPLKTHRPLVLTKRGQPVAVVQSLKDFERMQDELALLKAVNQGLKELDAGKGIPYAEARKRLGLKG